MTLGVAPAAGVMLIVWCKECRHQVERDPAEMATRRGAETAVLDWRERLRVLSAATGRSIWYSPGRGLDQGDWRVGDLVERR
jgi:hypothetical protein